jgi:ferritin-like metal-binding protein YciE
VKASHLLRKITGIIRTNIGQVASMFVAHAFFPPQDGYAIGSVDQQLKSTKTMEKASKKSTASKKQTSGYTQEENNSMLQELFIEELRDIYWAEKHLVKALPKMEKAASSEELANAFAEHLAATQEHVSRVEQVFEILGEKPRGKKCEAMEGLVMEAESVIEDTEEGTSTRDVALIIAAQKVEHYEIAAYGGLATLAKTMGKTEIKDLLGQTLDEEKETDEILTQLAESSINQSASQEQA